MAKFFNTVEDMENYHYGGLLQNELRKDAPMIQTTSGFRNIMYGAKLWTAILYSQNVLGALRKEAWKKSGYRVITEAGATADGGVADGGAIPATLKPTIAEIDMKAKQHVKTFDMGSILGNLQGKDDVVTFDEARQWGEGEFLSLLNKALCQNVTTVAGDNFERLDGIVSSYSEVTDCADVDPNDSDIFNLDRDAAPSVHDAYVSHNSNTERTFSIGYVNAVLQNVMPRWKQGLNGAGQFVENKVIFTGLDTIFRWGDMLNPRLRFGSERIQMGVNGVQSMKGVEGGTLVSTYMGIPVIPDPLIVQDTLSRIYAIDMNTCFLGILAPVKYSQVGDDEAEQILLGKLVKEGMYTMKGDLVCTQFKNQGKVRDLK